MNEPPKLRWGYLQWMVAILIPGCLLMLVVNFIFGLRIAEQQMKAENCCGQVLLALEQYAKQQGTVYPDGKHPEFKSANQLFRELFKERIILNEAIFGCPGSAFNPDNDIGHPPDYERALMPGECHWMVLKHQSSASHAKTPVVIENGLNAAWPPRWNVSFGLETIEGELGQVMSSWWGGMTAQCLWKNSSPTARSTGIRRRISTSTAKAGSTT